MQNFKNFNFKPYNNLDLGANIGTNLKALKYLFPPLERTVVEINKKAKKNFTEVIPQENIFVESISK